jgi:hypothetical protein
MHYIGLTKEEVVTMLVTTGEIQSGKVVSSEKLTEAIGQVIEENNKRLLEEWRKLR